jgi:hypothetical protein
MKLFGPIAPVGSGGARSASDSPSQLGPRVGPDDDADTMSDTVVACVVVAPCPEIVSVNVPVATPEVVETVSVELAPAFTDAGLKDPVAPAGRPLTDSVTDWVFPEVTWVLTVYCVLEPWTTVWLDGLALIEKSFVTGAVTVRPTVVACVAVDPVPVIVSVNVPAAVVDVVATERIELPPAVTDGGLNVPVAPAGSPLTERLTVCALPDVTAVVTVYDTLEPWTTL